MRLQVMVFVALGQLLCSVCQSADDYQNISYQLIATLSGSNLHFEHRLVNRSRKSICFYPENAHVASAHFFDQSGAEIENIANAGFITSPQTIYIAYADGKPHSFESSDDVHAIFKTTADAANASTVTYELYAYDCNALASKDHLKAPAILHRKITSALTREK